MNTNNKLKLICCIRSILQSKNQSDSQILLFLEGVKNVLENINCIVCASKYICSYANISHTPTAV